MRFFAVREDYSPYVADFDRDGCSDIFWYQPDDPAGLSELWRCIDGERNFACEQPVAHPKNGYPIGYGAAY